MKKVQPKPCPTPKPAGPVVSIATQIEAIQHRRAAISRRVDVLSKELNDLDHEACKLETQRLTLLRNFDTVSK